jgi:hypothetical protein
VGRQRISHGKGRLGVAAACALVAGIPTAALAVGSLNGSVTLPTARGTLAHFTPASVDPQIARLIARSGGAKASLMRFTPAGVPERAGRSVTVAVRVDAEAARAITVQSAISAASEAAVAGSALRIAPMRYNLGLARGYQSFAKAAVAPAPTLSRTLSDAAIPDLASYRPGPGVRENPSRFTPRNTASEPRAAAAPRALDSRDVTADQPVDVAGSYRLTRHIDVTAGLRYQSERDRLAPVADTAKQDNQAVYVGTQFRF